MVIDNKAEKYYPVSTYAYALSNPVRFIDPDGNEIVDATGKTIYTQKGGWVNNAPVAAMRIGNAMLKTETGRNQFNKLVSSDRKVALQIGSRNTDRPRALGKAGINLKISRATGEVYLDDNAITTITIYEEAIEDSRGTNRVNEGLTTEEAIGSTAAHEVEHAVDEGNLELAVVYANEQTEENLNAVEAIPTGMSDQVREESRNALKPIDPIQLQSNASEELK